MDLRDYQTQAISQTYRILREHRAALIVAATGLGKTVVFSRIARDAVSRGRRVLVVAHRGTIVEQSASTLARVCECEVAIDQAERTAHESTAPIVVSTVQSMSRRLQRYPADTFGLVVVDEAHHVVADTWRRVLDHFASAKCVGVTATPDRADKRKLGALFDDVVHPLDLRWGIENGWLVPIRQHAIELDQLDLGSVAVRRGDFAQDELGTVMGEEHALQGVCTATCDLAAGVPRLVFGVTVAHAHALLERFRLHEPDKRAEVITGATPPGEREDIVAAFRGGQVATLVNVGVLTEGFDAPNAGAIVVARPTRSAALYAQILGRGTRPIGVPRGTTPEARRAEIAASTKPSVIVLDFGDNARSHSLVSAVDILGDGEAEDVLELARELLRDPSSDVDNAIYAIDLARERVRERKLAALRVSYRSEEISPFHAIGADDTASPWAPAATEKQIEALARWGVSDDLDALGALDRVQASRLLRRLADRKSEDRATYKQARKLVQRGLPPADAWSLSFDDARVLLNAVAASRWRMPADALRRLRTTLRAS